MNFHEIVDLALPVEGVFRTLVFVGEHTRLACRFRRPAETICCGLNEVSGATPDTAGGTPALPNKI